MRAPLKNTIRASNIIFPIDTNIPIPPVVGEGHIKLVNKSPMKPIKIDSQLPGGYSHAVSRLKVGHSFLIPAEYCRETSIADSIRPAGERFGFSLGYVRFKSKAIRVWRLPDNLEGFIDLEPVVDQLPVPPEVTGDEKEVRSEPVMFRRGDLRRCVFDNAVVHARAHKQECLYQNDRITSDMNARASAFVAGVRWYAGLLMTEADAFRDLSFGKLNEDFNTGKILK